MTSKKHGNAKMEAQNSPKMALQWHVTARCDQHCKHCYMYGSPTYASEIKNELDLEKCEAVLADFEEYTKENGLQAEVHFTGGDPLLKPGFLELLEKTTKKFPVFIMGNPYHLDQDSARELKRLGARGYQISIDGMEKTHDYLRRLGSFKESLRALDCLKKAGIQQLVMFTVSKLNSGDLCDVIRLMAEKEIARFGFTRLVPIETGTSLKEQMLSSREYRKLLVNVLATLDELDEAKYGKFKAHIISREYLFKLLFWEKNRLGEYNEIMEKYNEKNTGCSANANHTVLADGTALICRRLPIIIGKVPEQKFSEIRKNPTIPMINDLDNYEKCSSCQLVSICLGNPCVACATHGSPFAPDPQCWK